MFNSCPKEYLRLVLLFLLFALFGCTPSSEKQGSVAAPKIFSDTAWCAYGIDELLPGDILVKPNVNMLPGTAEMPIGWSFGHAALVVKGYKHRNIDTLLANTVLVESMARDVDQAYQVRETKGYVENENLALNCTSFSSKYAGNRFRLRLNLPQAQIDSIVSFALAQKGDISCWNSIKSFPENVDSVGLHRRNWADNSHWYCSLLVWQSVYYVTGFDLDANGGYQVYPNDLIRSQFFNTNTSSFSGRARF
jgi:hypothetical protein